MALKVFDFKCRNCGYTAEHFIEVGQADKVLFDCPKCRHLMDRQFSAPAVHLDNSFPGQALKRVK